MPAQDPLSKMRSDILRAVKRADDSGFIAVKNLEEVPGEVYFSSSQWQKEVFRLALRSSDSTGGIGYSVHFSDKTVTDFDLLRLDIADGGQRLIITEGAFFFHVLFPDFKRSDPSANTLMRDVSIVAGRYFKTRGEISFKVIDNSDDVVTFSSNPELTLTQINLWSDRIDGVVEPKHLIFTVYKFHPKIEKFPDPTRWFPDDFKLRKLKE